MTFSLWVVIFWFDIFAQLLLCITAIQSTPSGKNPEVSIGKAYSLMLGFGLSSHMRFPALVDGIIGERSGILFATHA